MEAATRLCDLKHHRQRQRPEAPRLAAEFEYQFPHMCPGQRVQLRAEVQALFSGARVFLQADGDSGTVL